MEKQEGRSKKHGQKLIWLFVFLIALLTIWCLLATWEWPWRTLGLKNSVEDALSSLFGTLAFGGIIYTVILQSKELALQREELRLTREVNEKVAAAQEAASLAMKRQVHIQSLSSQADAILKLMEQIDSREYLQIELFGSNQQYKNEKKAYVGLIKKYIDLLKQEEDTTE